MDLHGDQDNYAVVMSDILSTASSKMCSGSSKYFFLSMPHSFFSTACNRCHVIDWGAKNVMHFVLQQLKKDYSQQTLLEMSVASSSIVVINKSQRMGVHEDSWELSANSKNNTKNNDLCDDVILLCPLEGTVLTLLAL